MLADVTAGSLNIPKAEKQELLETIDVKVRLNRILTLINRELEILELGKKIQSEVKGQMDKAQKDYYLREHIKALERELGETDEKTREITELLTRLEDARAAAPRHEGGGAGTGAPEAHPAFTRRTTRSSAIIWSG